MISHPVCDRDEAVAVTPKHCTGVCDDCGRIPYDSVKRLLDAITSAVALVLLSPWALILAAAIWLDNPGPVLFRQRRIGRCGETFTILKFRTMAVNCPNVSTEAMLGLGQSYVTRMGTLLRRTSIDELPQLWNILRGEMSFVGPRPALYNQTDLIDLRDAARIYTVRPGITGLAQVRGRDNLGVSSKVAYDREYVAKRTLRLDLWILWRTLAAVASSRGNY